MITAIDTNILLDILLPNEEFYEGSANALQDSAEDGSLVICDVAACQPCMANLPEQGGKRTRILADFLIGAHAQNQATRLLLLCFVTVEHAFQQCGRGPEVCRFEAADCQGRIDQSSSGRFIQYTQEGMVSKNGLKY